MNEEDKVAQEYKDAGVDLPELETKPADETPEPTPVAPVVEKEDEETPDDAPTLSTEPTEKPKRSIYDEYKDKKSENKVLEKENAELKGKLAAIETAKTPEQKQVAADDLEAFAKEIDADPETIRKMQQLFLKDLQKTGLSEEDRKVIEDARAITAAHSKAAEKQVFESEFTASLPTLKELLPNASDEEMTAIKAKVDELSHTKEFHDKELDYVIFKNKDVLTQLVSPKKRGIEGKGKQDVLEISNDFDPNADYSKMSAAQKEAWEKEYNKMGKSDGLVEDAQGRKLLI